MNQNHRFFILSQGGWTILGVSALLFLSACRETTPPKSSEEPASSAVKVLVNKTGPIVIQTSAAEFDILSSGYIQAFLLEKAGRKTLDDVNAGRPISSNSATVAGEELRDFKLDFANVKVTDARTKLGARGKRIEIAGKGSTAGGATLEKTLVVEVYDDFPNLALTTVAYKNLGSSDLKLDQVATQQHRFNASLAAASVPRYRLWSFQGSSTAWGKDDVIQISSNFSQPNVMGEPSSGGQAAASR